MNRDRRQQFVTASFFYVVLGTLFASAVAQDLLQAIGIGGGWTGIVGSFALKQDHLKRAERKDEALAEGKEYILRVAVSRGTEARNEVSHADSASVEALLERMSTALKL